MKPIVRKSIYIDAHTDEEVPYETYKQNYKTIKIHRDVKYGTTKTRKGITTWKTIQYFHFGTKNEYRQQQLW